MLHFECQKQKWRDLKFVFATIGEVCITVSTKVLATAGKNKKRPIAISCWGFSLPFEYGPADISLTFNHLW